MHIRFTAEIERQRLCTLICFYCCVVYNREKNFSLDYSSKNRNVNFIKKNQKTLTPQKTTQFISSKGRRQDWKALVPFRIIHKKNCLCNFGDYLFSVCMLVCFPVELGVCMEIKLFDTAATTAGTDHCEFMYHQKENKQENICSRLMQRWKWARALIHKRNSRYLPFYFGYGDSCLFRCFSTAITVVCCL